MPCAYLVHRSVGEARWVCVRSVYNEKCSGVLRGPACSIFGKDFISGRRDKLIEHGIYDDSFIDALEKSFCFFVGFLLIVSSL